MNNFQLARILIIEDEPMIALSLQDMLVVAGFEIAGVARKLEKALELIELRDCDAAIVDANLAGVSAGPAGTALAALGLPFVVLSGYSNGQQQGTFPNAALILQKPCEPALLIAMLNQIAVRH